MFEEQFRDFMTQSVSIRTPLTRDLYGAIMTWTDSTVYQCRIKGKILSLRRMGGEERTQVFDIWLAPQAGESLATDVFTLEDEITLPDADLHQGQVPKIFAIDRVPDDDGQHHVKIQCGWTYHRQGQ